MATPLTFKIKRFNPQSQKTSTQTFKFPTTAQQLKRLTVLEALNAINEKQQTSISYRYSCQMGICGSCGAVVNGKPVLMCSTFCRELSTPIIIEPLRNFPIVKDLVTDTDAAMNKLREALPYTSFVTNKNKKILKQSPKQLKKLEQTSQCIKCMLCYSACPIYGFDNNFTGPAAIATAYRYNHDAHDTLKHERMNLLTRKTGVWKCNFVGECSVVCPKNVDPADAIQKLKVMGAIHVLKPSARIPSPNRHGKTGK